MSSRYMYFVVLFHTIMLEFCSAIGCNSVGSCSLKSNSGYIGSEIYCTDLVDSCSVNCTTNYNNGCHDSIIWLSATTNTLRCDESQTCENVIVYCGSSPVYPQGLTSTDFDNIVEECNVICTGFLSCSNMKLYCNAHVTSCTITADYNFAFASGSVDCNNNANDNNICNIFCGTNNADCQESSINCNDMQYCSCSGACASVSINSISPTPSPTYIPTYQPTAIPTNLPTYVPTYIPTFIPTNIPTNVPTYIPTNLPTNMPTYNPSIYPTINPTFVPTTDALSFINITTTSVRTVQTEDNGNTAKENNENNYFMLTLIFAAIVLFLVCIAAILWKKRKKYMIPQTNSKMIVEMQNETKGEHQNDEIEMTTMNTSIVETAGMIKAENDLDVDQLQLVSTENVNKDCANNLNLCTEGNNEMVNGTETKNIFINDEFSDSSDEDIITNINTRK
eukprot:301324_1